MSSRSANASKNLVFGLWGQIFNTILAFAARTVFIYILTEEYLGINGLFSNILSVLSISELGIGSAIAFALYEPLAKKDIDKIYAIMSFYKKAYKIIGFVVVGVGIIFLPFLPYLMKGTTDIVNIYVIYVCYIFESATSYWFYSYKATLLRADQKTYILSLLEYVVSLLRTVLRIMVLILFKEVQTLAFYAYTIVGLGTNIVYNLLVSYRVNAKYPFLKEKKEILLDLKEKREIKKNVIALSLHKVGAVMNESTDNIFISAALGIGVTGIYSNYSYIVTIINQAIRIFASSIGAGIGNLNVLAEEEKKKSFLESLHFIYFWIYGFCAICLYELLNPFIVIWVGKQYQLSKGTVLIIVLNFLIYGLMSAVTQFLSEAGLFWNSKIIPVTTLILNICLTAIFAFYFRWGIAGVLGATILSRLLITLPFSARIVYKKLFHENGIEYVFCYFKSLLIICVTCFIVDIFMSMIDIEGVIGLSVKILVCVCIPNCIWFMLYKKKREFIYIIAVVTQLTKRGKKG